MVCVSMWMELIEERRKRHFGYGDIEATIAEDMRVGIQGFHELRAKNSIHSCNKDW